MYLSIKKVPRFIHSDIFKHRNYMFQIRCCCKKMEDDTKIPTNPLKKFYSANDQSTNGAIYDTKPFKFTCIAGKTYQWCLCGRSHRQPFCDGTHKNQHLKIKHRPIRFTVEETKDYWLCNCKQTSNRPFCDGTHLREDIQEKK